MTNIKVDKHMTNSYKEYSKQEEITLLSKKMQGIRGKTSEQMGLETGGMELHDEFLTAVSQYSATCEKWLF